MKHLLQRLAEISGPSGHEDAVRALIRKEIKGLGEQVQVDALGNVIARKGHIRKGGRRILLAAHMDEVGLMASHVDDNGFVRFTTIGRVPARYLPGGRVRFLDGTTGVIGHDRVDDEQTVPAIEKLFIDVGVSSKKDSPVKVGDVAAFESPSLDLDGRVVAKSLGSRAGLVILIETMRRLKAAPNEVYFVFTAQQEVGARGAGAAAYAVDPEAGIVVEATSAGDTPGSAKSPIALGHGPVVRVKDESMLADPQLVKWMTRTAEKGRIPHQREVRTGGAGDASAIQLTRGGIPVGCLSVPVRYLHSPSEMIAMDDLENSVRLLVALLRTKVEL